MKCRSGTKGITSTAPIRGWAPRCVRMSIRATAARGRLEQRLLQRARLPHEAHDQPVVVGIGPVVEQVHARRVPERRHDGIDHFLAPAFAEIRHAFDEPARHGRSRPCHRDPQAPSRQRPCRASGYPASA